MMHLLGVGVFILGLGVLLLFALLSTPSNRGNPHQQREPIPFTRILLTGQLVSTTTMAREKAAPLHALT
jgi:hypothetical protein